MWVSNIFIVSTLRKGWLIEIVDIFEYEMSWDSWFVEIDGLKFKLTCFVQTITEPSRMFLLIFFMLPAGPWPAWTSTTIGSWSSWPRWHSLDCTSSSFTRRGLRWWNLMEIGSGERCEKKHGDVECIGELPGLVNLHKTGILWWFNGILWWFTGI